MGRGSQPSCWRYWIRTLGTVSLGSWVRTKFLHFHLKILQFTSEGSNSLSHSINSINFVVLAQLINDLIPVGPAHTLPGQDGGWSIWGKLMLWRESGYKTELIAVPTGLMESRFVELFQLLYTCYISLNFLNLHVFLKCIRVNHVITPFFAVWALSHWPLCNITVITCLPYRST